VFRYTSSPDQKSVQKTLEVAIHGALSVLDLSLLDVEVSFTPWNMTQQRIKQPATIVHMRKDYASNLLMLVLLNEPGFFYFGISYSGPPLTCAIAVSQLHDSTLYPGMTLVGTLRDDGSHVYELHVNDATTSELCVHISTCHGHTELFQGTTLENSYKGEPLRSLSFDPHEITQEIKLPSPANHTTFLRVHGTQGSHVLGAAAATTTYKIRTHRKAFHGSCANPMRAGSNGDIDIERLATHKYRIRFAPVELSTIEDTHDLYHRFDITYGVIVASNRVVLAERQYCGAFSVYHSMDYSPVSQLHCEMTWGQGGNCQFTFETLHNEDSFVTLTASVIDKESREKYSVAYSIRELRRDTAATWWAWIVLPACVFSVIAAVYFWRRSKVLTKKIEFEMQDVRRLSKPAAADTPVLPENNVTNATSTTAAVAAKDKYGEFQEEKP
jgi:hypothetical protein